MVSGHTPPVASPRSGAVTPDTTPLPAGVIPTPRAEADPLAAAKPRGGRKAAWVALPVLVVGVGVAGLVVAHHTGGQSPRVPAAPAMALAQRPAADQGFLTTVRQRPAFTPLSDDALVGMGHTLCEQLRAGVDPAEVGVRGGADAQRYAVEDMSTAVGAAAGAYCPEQMSRVAEPGVAPGLSTG